jgi:hypothetical protein
MLLLDRSPESRCSLGRGNLGEDLLGERREEITQDLGVLGHPLGVVRICNRSALLPGRWIDLAVKKRRRRGSIGLDVTGELGAGQSRGHLSVPHGVVAAGQLLSDWGEEHEGEGCHGGGGGRLRHLDLNR